MQSIRKLTRRSSSHVCDGTTTKTSKRTETKVRTIEKTETVTSDSEGDGEGKGRGKKRQECPPYTPPHRGPPGLYRPPAKKHVVQTVPVKTFDFDGVVSDVKRIHKSTKHLTEQNQRMVRQKCWDTVVVTHKASIYAKKAKAAQRAVISWAEAFKAEFNEEAGGMAEQMAKQMKEQMAEHMKEQMEQMKKQMEQMTEQMTEQMKEQMAEQMEKNKKDMAETADNLKGMKECVADYLLAKQLALRPDMCAGIPGKRTPILRTSKGSYGWVKREEHPDNPKYQSSLDYLYAKYLPEDKMPKCSAEIAPGAVRKWEEKQGMKFTSEHTNDLTVSNDELEELRRHETDDAGTRKRKGDGKDIWTKIVRRQIDGKLVITRATWEDVCNAKIETWPTGAGEPGVWPNSAAVLDELCGGRGGAPHERRAGPGDLCVMGLFADADHYYLKLSSSSSSALSPTNKHWDRASAYKRFGMWPRNHHIAPPQVKGGDKPTN